MAITITATVDVVTGSVLLDVSGGTSPYSLLADPSGRAPYVPRGGWTVDPMDPEHWTTVDGELPLNVATTYSAQDSLAANAVAAPVTVASSVPLLSDARDYSAVMPVVIVGQLPNEWEARSRTWDVLGRVDPFVSVAPLRLRQGPVQLYCATAADRDQVLELCYSGSPLLLRATTDTAIDDVVMAVQRVREELVLEDDKDGPRLLTLDYQAVSRRLGRYVPDAGRSWLTVLSEAASWLELRATYDTWDDARAGAPS